MTKKLVALTLMIALAILGLSSTASAEVPDHYPLQGYLTDDAGEPIDGEVDLRLRLYDNAENVVFQELQAIDVTNGQFTANLGAQEVLDAELFAQYPALELGIKVGTDDEMSPRLPLGTAPYAARAATAATADEATFADEAGFADMAADVENAIEVYEVTNLNCEETPGTLSFDDKCYANQDVELDDDDPLIACLIGNRLMFNCSGQQTCVNDSTYCDSPPCLQPIEHPRLDVPRCDNEFIGKLVP